MKKFVIVVATSLIAVHASAQFSFEASAGFGQYKLSDLKRYQEQASVKNFPVNSVISDKFPAYWFYGANLRWTHKTMQFGFAGATGTTGGQIYYRDYSGYRKQTNTLYYTSLAVIVAKRVDLGDNLSISFDPRPGVSLGGLRSAEKTDYKAFDGTLIQQVSNHAWYTALNFSAEPTVTATYRRGVFGVSAFAGYHIDLRNDEFSSPTHGYVQAQKGFPPNATMDLSGVRVGASVGVYLNKTGGEEQDFERFYIGPGIGLDYGGIGANLTVMATRHLGFYAGLGYNLKGFGYNGGARVYVVGTENHLRPYFSAMYGYNAVLIVKNNHSFDKVTFGPTAGFGVDVKSGDKNYCTVALYVPFRDPEMSQHINYLKVTGGTIERDLWPVTFSLGYRFGL